MNGKRVYFLMLGLIAFLVIGLFAGAYETNTLLGSRAGDLTKLKAKSKSLDKEQQSLVAAKRQIKTNSDFNAIATSIVPQDKDQAKAVREIVNIAGNNGIALGSITFPTSTLGLSPAPVAGASGTASAAATPVKPFANSGTKSKSSALSQLQPVKNIPGVYDLQIMVSGDPSQSVDYNQFIAFLSDLEHNRRTAQVSAITLSPDPKNAKNLTFSLTLDEYIKP
jgi:hypothetical protein